MEFFNEAVQLLFSNGEALRDVRRNTGFHNETLARREIKEFEPRIIALHRELFSPDVGKTDQIGGLNAS